MLEKNSYKFDFEGFDEKETNDRLCSLYDVRDMLERVQMTREIAGKDVQDVLNMQFAILDMSANLQEHANNKDYDIWDSVYHSEHLENDLMESQLKKEHDDKMRDTNEIDESQFEVTDQNQRTL